MTDLVNNDWPDMSLKNKNLGQYVAAYLVKQAGDILNIPGIFIKKLLTPDTVYQTNFLVSLESQSMLVSAARIQYSNILGPYKGGIRLVSYNGTTDLVNIARINTLKAGMAKVPFGGAAGFININRTNLTADELKTIGTAFMERLSCILGPNNDIVTPDLKTDSSVIDILVNVYMDLVGEFVSNIALGKSTSLKGTLLYEQAIGLVAVYILDYLFSFIVKSAHKFEVQLSGFDSIKSVANMSTNERRIAIHGFGKVGQSVAQTLFYQGYKIIAVSDSKGVAFNENGLDIEQLISIKKEYGSIVRAGDILILQDNKFWGVDADIMVLASKENVLQANNASKLKAGIVLELAKGAVTVPALQVFVNKNKLYIPDIVGGLGEELIIELEYQQNLKNIFYPKNKIIQVLQERVLERLGAVFEIIQKHSVRLDVASYILAVQEIYSKYLEIEGGKQM